LRSNDSDIMAAAGHRLSNDSDIIAGLRGGAVPPHLSLL
jgi:hypothetical protein